MKLLLALIFVLICSTASSQNQKRFAPDVTPKFPLYRYDFKNKKLLPHNDHVTLNFQSRIAALKGRGGIVFLPQDHMPCIIPPAPTQGLITNFWQGSNTSPAPAIPNPAEPLELEKRFKNN
jgi:hypothetical protein